MKDVVLFSGGLDSTLTVLLLLEERKKSYNKEPLYLLSFENPFINNLKRIKEKEARKNNIEKIKDIYPDIELHEITSMIKIDAPTCHTSLASNTMGLKQPLMWLLPSIEMFDKDVNLYISYIIGDCAPYMEHEIQELVKISNKISGTNIQLYFPLRHCNKIDIIEKFIENKKYIELLDLVWTCENPLLDGTTVDTIASCSKCVPCKTFIECTITALYRTTQYPEYYKRYVFDYIYKLLKNKYNFDLNDYMESIYSVVIKEYGEEVIDSCNTNQDRKESLDTQVEG